MVNLRPQARWSNYPAHNTVFSVQKFKKASWLTDIKLGILVHSLGEID